MTTRWEELRHIKTILWDYQRHRAEITLIDGSQVSSRLDPQPDLANVEWSRIDVECSTVSVKLRHHDVLTLELGGGGAADATLLGSRPIIYLDQLHFITICDRIHLPNKVPKAQRAFADRIVELARGRQIVLPLSSAHIFESAPTSGAYRYALADGMFELSRGWQMMDVLSTRRIELFQMMRSMSPAFTSTPAPSPISLDPWTMWSSGETESDSGLSGQWDELYRRATSVLGLYSMLADSEPEVIEKSPPGTSWANTHRNLSHFMAQKPKNHPHRKEVVKAWMIRDLMEDLSFVAALLGIDVKRMRRWLEEEFFDALLQAP